MHDVKYEKVHTTNGNSARLYNLQGKLVVRDAMSGEWWVMDDYDQFVAQDINTSDFNLSLLQPNYIIGYIDSGTSCVIYISNEGK